MDGKDLDAVYAHLKRSSRPLSLIFDRPGIEAIPTAPLTQACVDSHPPPSAFLTHHA